MKLLAIASLFIALLPFASPQDESDLPEIVVGSKVFTESYILAEILSQKIEATGKYKVVRKFGLGGTGILFEALHSGNIDVYPEYTGTIKAAILEGFEGKTSQELIVELRKRGFDSTRSLGFNNTYAIAMKKAVAKQLNINSISDLNKYPNLKLAFSHEFLKRPDGYPGLSRIYGLNLKHVTGIEHALAYNALQSGQIDVTDIYSTDGKIKSMDLKLLADDRQFFPEYLGVFLFSSQFKEKYPEAWETVVSLEGQIANQTMSRLNAAVDVKKQAIETVASGFLNVKAPTLLRSGAINTRIKQRTKEHLFLVFIALAFSVGIGLPLGILASRNPFVGQIVLNMSGLFQTIPSLALLAFLIPFFGIGQTPALIALVLYGLLPVVVNTNTGLTSIDPKHKEVAKALGLTKLQLLLKIELPLASPSILAGVKTSVIISIGTATLAALIGAGGYGVPIMTGIALNNMESILEGAIPAAMLALAVSFVLEILNRKLIPKGIR